MAKGLTFHDNQDSGKTLPQNDNSQETPVFNQYEGTSFNLTEKSSSIPSNNNYQGKNVVTQPKKFNPANFTLKKIILLSTGMEIPTTYQTNSEAMIYVNPRNGKIVENNFWTRLTNDLVQYWVSYQNVDEVKGLQVSLFDSQTGRNISLIVDYQVQIVHGQGERAVGLLSRGTSPAETLNESVIQWVKAYCSIQDNLAENFFRIEESLKIHLHSKGREHGLSIKAFLRPEMEDAVLNSYTLIDHIVTCKIKNYTVDVKVTLALNLENERLFRMSNITDLDRVMRKKSEQIIQNELMAISYAQLVRDFHPNGIEGKIQNSINYYAQSVGFSVTQLVAIPDLDIFQLLERVYFVTDKDENGRSINDQEYATKDTRINVKLSIAVNGRIRNFAGQYMEKHLRPGIDITQKMKETVVEECKKLLHQTEPQHFYFHFSSLPEEGASFEKELKTIISDKLEKEFNADELIITIKPVDTETTLRFKRLQQGSHKLTVTNFFGEVGFDIWYKIITIHPQGWYLFQSNDYPKAGDEINEVSRKIRNYIEHYFNDRLPTDFFHVKGESFLTDLIKIIEGPVEYNNSFWLSDEKKPNCAKNEVIKEFGLIIKLVDIKRHATSIEGQLILEKNVEKQITENRQYQRLEQAKIISQNETADLDELYRKRMGLKENGTDEEVAAIEEQIRDIGKAVLKGTERTSRLKQLENSEDEIKKLNWSDDNNQTNRITGITWETTPENPSVPENTTTE